MGLARLFAVVEARGAGSGGQRPHPLAYGVAANRTVLDTFLRYSYDQTQAGFSRRIRW